jgi:hypothetical protein
MPSTASRVAAFGLTAAIGLTLAGCAASLPATAPPRSMPAITEMSGLVR